MRIHADLHRFHAQRADALGFLLPDQNSVGLEFYAERAGVRVLQDLEKILAHHDLAAADGQKEDSGIRHLVEQGLDFRGGHLSVIVVVEVAMDAALVAAIGQIQLHAERNVQFEGLGGHFRH